MARSRRVPDSVDSRRRRNNPGNSTGGRGAGPDGRIGTVADLIEHGAARFAAARLAFGHGTTNAADEAAYLVAHALRVPRRAPPRARAGAASAGARDCAVLRLFERRIAERRPAAYLVRERGSPATGSTWTSASSCRARTSRSSCATGLPHGWRDRAGCAPRSTCAPARAASRSCSPAIFPRARIDAADISPAALEVARFNVRRYRLGRAHPARPVRSLLGARGTALRPYRLQSALRDGLRHAPAAGGIPARAAPRSRGGRGRPASRAPHPAPGRCATSIPADCSSWRSAAAGGGWSARFRDVDFVWPELATGYPVFIATREQQL